jgi:hypothetical protein
MVAAHRDLKQERPVAHTPGPWLVENSGPQDQGEWHYWTVQGPAGIIVQISAAHQRGPIDMDRNAANARLIAAAPELYATLDRLVSDIEEYERVNNIAPSPGHQDCWASVTLAKAALAKARGEKME